MKMIKLSEDHYIVVDNKEMHTIPTSEAKELLGVVDVEKKYTEEDMQWALHHAKYHQELTIEEIIQALHQPKTEWQVEMVDGKLKLKQ